MLTMTINNLNICAVKGQESIGLKLIADLNVANILIKRV